MTSNNVRDLIPGATMSDRAALALAAWHSLIAGGKHKPAAAAVTAFEFADQMLAEIIKQEGWKG